MKFVLFGCVFTLAFVIVVCKPNESSRVKKDVKLSDKEHFDADGKHNPDYDHDAFLGSDQAITFKDLTPEESKAKLGELFDKVDKDKDGIASEEELRDWIEHQQNGALFKEVDRQWNAHNTNGDNKLTWAEFNMTTYSNLPLEKLVTMKEDKIMNFRKRIRQDKARWTKADQDKDEALTYEEFVAFLYPRERQHMKDIAVAETVEDMDKDGDGYINLEEFIGDLWNGEGEEPDWVKSERNGFLEYRDRDGDGKLNDEEISHWIMPADFDPTLAEAKHLIFMSDKDKNKNLTKEEMVENYEMFVGSQVTNFGELRHDEF